MRDASIRVSRPEARGDPDRNTPYRVRIDGEVVGDLWSGKTLVYPVSAGEHRVQILANQTVSWFTSNEVVVSSGHGRTAGLSCKLRRGLPAVNLVFRPKKYLLLEALSPEASIEMEARIKSDLDRPALPPRDLRPLLNENKGLPEERLPDAQSPDGC